jgi:2-hydroxy-6-oxonona-2,4-dienedioate hydrolase
MSELTDEGTSRYVQTKSWKLHCNEAGSGHPVILLHGSGAGATGWSNFRPNIGPLAERFRAIAWDAPGWGRSDSAPSDSYDHPAAVIELMDELGIEKAALVGNSMGGMTSIATALRHPERVSHLVSMGAPVPGTNVFSPAGGPTEGLKVLLRAYVDPSPENMRQLVSIMVFDQAAATRELAELRSSAALAHPEHLDSWNNAEGGNPLSREYFTYGLRLPEITAPTLAIHGRDDRVVSYEHSLRLVSAIPDSRLLLLNQCGHWAQIEHAAEFNRVVREFIQNH